MNPDRDDAAACLQDAEAVIARLRPLAGAQAEPDLQEHLAVAWFRQIDALRRLDRAADVIETADRLCAHFEPAEGGPVISQVAGWIAQAQRLKADALVRLDRFADALEVMTNIRGRFGKSDAADVREIVASTGLEEATLRAQADTPFAKVDMVRHCSSLIDHFGKDDRPGTRLAIARARALQARLLAELGEHDEALKNYGVLHDDLAHASDPALQEQAADALLEQARLLAKLGRTNDAQEGLNRIVATYAGATQPGQRATLALAQLDIVLDLWRRQDPDGDDPAERQGLLAALDMLLQAHADSSETIALRCVNTALRMKADVLRTGAAAEDRAAADALTDAQWARHASHEDVSIQRDVMLAMLDRLDDAAPADALAGYRRMLDRFGASEAAALQPTLARTRLLEAWTLRQLERPADALTVLTALDRDLAPCEDIALRLWRVQGRVEQARILRGEGDPDAALLALDEILAAEDPTECGSDTDLAFRKAIVRAMALRAELWQDQVPPPYAVEEGQKEQAATGPLHAAQRQHGFAITALRERFATDPSPDIRARVASMSYDHAVELRRHRHFQQAADCYTEYLAVFAADTCPAVEETTASAYLNLGYLLMERMDQPEAALPVYDAVLARFANVTGDQMRATLAKAAASRLKCLNRLQRAGAAPSYGAQYPDLSLEERTALSDTIGRGRELVNAEEHRAAIACFDEVLAAHGDAFHPELRRLCVDAMVRKAYSLSRLAQREDALAVSDALIARYGNDLSMEIEEDVALAMSYRATQLDKLGRHAEEIETYDTIIARWADSDVPSLRERVGSARFNKALTIADRDLDGALALFVRLMDDLSAPQTAMRLRAAKAAVEYALRLRRVGRHAEAIAGAQTLVAACGTEGDPAIRQQVAKARIGLAKSYGQVGQTQRQIDEIEALLALPDRDLSDAQRATLRTELARVRPPASAIGRAAQALGNLFGKRA